MVSYFDHFVLISLVGKWATNSTLILLPVIILFVVSNLHTYIVPSSIQIMIEIIFEHWLVLVSENLGESYVYNVLFLSGLFMFILGVNFFGSLVYTLPVTTHISLTFGGALIIWAAVVALGFNNFKSSFFSVLMPSGAPLLMSPFLVLIELVSNVSSPVALGMSLAANLTAGHILLAILADLACNLLFYGGGITNLVPIIVIIFITILESGVMIIQAYVFSLLIMIYLSDGSVLH